MTRTDDDFPARLARVLTVGAEQLRVGRVVPAFDANRPRLRPHRAPHRFNRKVVALGATVGLAVTGTAAAAVVAPLTSAPVTQTDEARCYSVDSLAGGDDFAGLTTAASGPVGSPARVTHALADCALSWQDGFLTLGSTKVNRVPSSALDPDHPVPPLVVCVLPSGIAAVFPGDSTVCQSLGLPAARRPASTR